MPVVPESEKVTCFICRRRLVPEKMEGTRCKDKDACLAAMGKRVSKRSPTEAESAAYSAKVENWRNA